MNQNKKYKMIIDVTHGSYECINCHEYFQDTYKCEMNFYIYGAHDRTHYPACVLCTRYTVRDIMNSNSAHLYDIESNMNLKMLELGTFYTEGYACMSFNCLQCNKYIPNQIGYKIYATIGSRKIYDGNVMCCTSCLPKVKKDAGINLNMTIM